MPSCRLPRRKVDVVRLLRKRVAGVQIPNPAHAPHARRQEAVAVHVDMLQHGAGHLVHAPPRAAHAADVLKPQPFGADVADDLGQARLLVFRQPVEPQAGKLGAERLNADVPDVAAPYRRAQLEIAGLLAHAVELPFLPRPRGRVRRRQRLVAVHRAYGRHVAACARACHHAGGHARAGLIAAQQGVHGARTRLMSHADSQRRKMLAGRWAHRPPCAEHVCRVSRADRGPAAMFSQKRASMARPRRLNSASPAGGPSSAARSPPRAPQGPRGASATAAPSCASPPCRPAS